LGRNILAHGQRTCSGNEASKPSHAHGAGSASGAGHTEQERQRRYQTVIHAEDSCLKSVTLFLRATMSRMFPMGASDSTVLAIQRTSGK
jgi:hypothetical protein